MNTFEFAKSEIKEILNALPTLRKCGELAAYKTLTDTFKRFVDILMHQKGYDDIRKSIEFYNEILMKLSGEEKELANTLKEMRIKKDFKRHNDYMHAYERLLRANRDVTHLRNNAMNKLHDFNKNNIMYYLDVNRTDNGSILNGVVMNLEEGKVISYINDANKSFKEYADIVYNKVIKDKPKQIVIELGGLGIGLSDRLIDLFNKSGVAKMDKNGVMFYSI